MTPSGKQCEGKIKIKTQTLRVSRPCETASGDECEGEFQKKIREIYEDKDGTWVMIRREQSQDGGETWKALPMSLTELAKFILSADEAEALPDARKCCKDISTTTASPSPKDCKLSEWSDWTTCSASCGSGTRSRSRTVVSPGESEGLQTERMVGLDNLQRELRLWNAQPLPHSCFPRRIRRRMRLHRRGGGVPEQGMSYNEHHNDHPTKQTSDARVRHGEGRKDQRPNRRREGADPIAGP